MKTKKNIDRLFQERFKDFEMEPNEQTWSNIQAVLKKKEERKIVPLWLKCSGIAAAFLLGFFALNTIFKTTEGAQNRIVLETNPLNTLTTDNDSVPTNPKEYKKHIPLKNNLNVVLKEDKKTQKIKKNKKEIPLPVPTKITSGTRKYQNTIAVYLKKSTLKDPDSSETVLNEVAKNELIIATKSSVFAKKDSIKEYLLAPANELQLVLKAKEEEKFKTNTRDKNKWEITPKIVALHPQTSSRGSTIDPQFSENSKTTDNSIGFGVGVNYAISKKIVLRSGINKFTLSHNTNNVSYSSGLNNNNLANINYTTNAPIEVLNNADINSIASSERDLQKRTTGSINQRVGYYEVPIELSYVFLNKKTSITLIGGISTFFLEENKISLISREDNIKLGEAKNLSSIHFSTNLGLGFQYKFVKSFHLNIEPMIKYQLNTSSSNSGSFKPVLIGLYSGISYHF
ncbi:MAG: hypothetical protein ACI9M1_000386 [Porticoccaceae bacterium]|jgi:hypothetical protein